MAFEVLHSIFEFALSEFKENTKDFYLNSEDSFEIPIIIDIIEDENETRFARHSIAFLYAIQIMKMANMSGSFDKPYFVANDVELFISTTMKNYRNHIYVDDIKGFHGLSIQEIEELLREKHTCVYARKKVWLESLESERLLLNKFNVM